MDLLCLVEPVFHLGVKGLFGRRSRGAETAPFDLILSHCQRAAG